MSVSIYDVYSIRVSMLCIYEWRVCMYVCVVRTHGMVWYGMYVCTLCVVVVLCAYVCFVCMYVCMLYKYVCKYVMYARYVIYVCNVSMCVCGMFVCVNVCDVCMFVWMLCMYVRFVVYVCA